jgi:cytochrome c oxidase cbb3-type subunit IV
MYQEFFAKSDMLVWPLMGLLIFMAIFTGVLAYVFLGLRDRNKIDEIASLPLADDEMTASETEGEPAHE